MASCRTWHGWHGSPRWRRIGLPATLCVLLGACLLGVLSAPAAATAAVLHVQTPANGGSEFSACTETEPCATILHAVALAKAGEVISVGPGTFAEETEILIDKDLTIEGASASTTTVSGGADRTLIVVAAGASAVLANLTVADSGEEPDASDSTGVRNEGQITLSECGIENNTYGFYNYGGAAKVIRSVIALNGEFGVESDGGTTEIHDTGVFFNHVHGVVNHGGSIDVDESTVESTAQTPSEYYKRKPQVTIDGHDDAPAAVPSHAEESTLDGFAAQAAITPAVLPPSASEGAGVLAESGVTTIASSTIAHNRDFGVYTAEATTSIKASTIDENRVGVHSEGEGGSTTILESTISARLERPTEWGVEAQDASVTLAASIVTGAPACSGSSAVIDAGYNVDGDGSCGFSAAMHSISDSPSIELEGLGENGGLTATDPPAPGSVAVAAIPATATATIAGNSVPLCKGTSDQRGVDRPQPAGGDCDIGAVELGAVTTTVSASPASPALGEPVTLTATVASGLTKLGLAPPQGSVSFSLEGGAAIAGCEDVELTTVEGAGTGQQATCTTEALPLGEDRARAVYAPASAYHASAGTLPVTVVAPTTLYVATDGSDSGRESDTCIDEAQPCKTISHAVAVAQAGDRISVGAGTFSEDGGIVIDSELTIEGASAGPATIVAGGDDETLITISSGAHLALSHLTVEGAGSGEGIGIENLGKATIADSTISDNYVGVYERQATTTVTGSTISGSRKFGVYDLGGTTTITTSTLSDNAEAVYTDEGTISVAASTIADSAQAGLRSNHAATTITNSTLSENAVGADTAAGSTTVLASTISARSEPSELGLESDEGASVTLAASIVTGAPACSGSSAVIDAGYNIDSDGSCGLSAAMHSISDSLRIDLEGLGQNGGPTETQLPAPGSVAVAAIPATATAMIAGNSVPLCEGASDQRGVARPQPAGGDCDIGAVELAGSETALAASPPAPGAEQSVTLTATVTPALGSPVLPAPAGHVSFVLAGHAVSGCESVALGTVGDARQAVCITTLPAGVQTLTASYQPSAGYHASTSSLSLSVAVAGSGGTGGGGSGGTGGGGSGGVAGFHSRGGTSSLLAVALSGLRVSPARFAAASSGPSATAVASDANTRESESLKRKGGATVSFTLNQPATVLFKVAQRLRGRVGRGGHCAKQTSANRRARACTRTVTLVGAFRRTGAKGVNSFHFSGRLAARKLAPGAYLLLATPSTPGRSGPTRSFGFTIVG